jgi:HAMP domain-containing protein
MAALGGVTYRVTADLLARSAHRQLDAIAASKKQDLERVMVGWQDRVRLITSRTQLRASLEALAREDSPEDVARLEQILEDVLGAVETLRGISLYASDGRPVAFSGLDPGGQIRPAAFWLADAPLVHEDVFLDEDGQLLITFIAPVRRDGRLVGGTKVVLEARELIDVTSDVTGLGETGETLIARLEENGDALVLNPLRHDPEAALRRRIPATHLDDPVIRAFQVSTTDPTEMAVDYRGQPVFAASRPVGSLEFALVVKLDQEEELRSVVELRLTMLKLALSLSGFAVVAGTLLAMAFARPIRELADVAQRIGAGELELRAESRSDDEVGQLAESFNRMAERLVADRRLELGEDKDES